MTARFTLAAKYAFFALVATVVNILTQCLCLSLYAKAYSLYVAMAFGTLAGLVLKYVLDRKYIFYYCVESRTEDLAKFVLYSFMGAFTTVIFWLFELGFHALFEHPAAKYVGAVQGLTTGYATKYLLDKRFVFRKAGMSGSRIT
jgi:hypothetical protein